jgi:hypothetical protein
MIRKSSHIMTRRVAAAQATLDHFEGKPFAWGSCDCSRIIAWHLRKLGHKPGVARFGNYRTALGARAALTRGGFASLADVIDAIGLPRIAPAAALVGDIVQGESGDPFGAMGIYLGNGAMLGFHEDAPGATKLRRIALSTAWSVA